MLEPKGFPNRTRRRYRIENVVKPNLGLTSSGDNGTCGIPAKYSLYMVVMSHEPSAEVDEFERALLGPGLPQSMLDSALRSLTAQNNGNGISSSGGGDDSKIERLEDEVLLLKQQIAALHSTEDRRKERKLARMKMRDDIDLEKRRAYFEAKKNGQDGDSAMKKWEEKRAVIDLESDNEDGEDEMDVG